MQRPGSALSKLKLQQQNLHANVTQKAVQKKYTQKKNSSVIGILKEL